MIDKIKEYVKKEKMFAKGDYVVAGVSGGADSICLLCVLLELQREIPMTIHVVHINHMIREEAGEDAAYVEAFCKERNLPFTLVEADVEQIAKSKHISTEEAGREVRYAAFHNTLEQNRQGRRGRIAIAHNRNDCCETFLFHLFRGSGLKGLTGIPAVRGEIVRPLLHTDRSEIERYLEQNDIYYCMDRTNLEDNYTRNRIRHHILQPACEAVCENAPQHIQEACGKIGEAYALIEDLTRQAYQECTRKDGRGIHIEQESFGRLHTTIQSYVMLEALAKAAGNRKDLETVHVEQLLGLLDSQTGRRINLPYGVVAVREYQGIRLNRMAAATVGEEEREYGRIEKNRLGTGEEVIIETKEGQFELMVMKTKPDRLKEIPSNIYTKWFDYDKIKGDIVIRNRRKGDYFTLNADNHKKSLKTYLIDEKVPAEDRKNVYLVTEGQHCLWIVGKRISNWYKVSEDTKYILQIRYLRRNQQNG